MAQIISEVKSDMLIYDRSTLEDREYWVNRLFDLAETSSIRTDRPRPGIYQAESGSYEIEICGELYAKLNKVTAGGDFLLYTALVAALKVCLYKYSGSNNIVIGTPVRKRESHSLQTPNALAILDRLDDQLSFRQLLLKVRQTLLDAYARQLYPYDQLVRDLCLEGIDNRCPLFDIAVVLKELHGDMPEVRNDITITLSRKADRIAGSLSFRKYLFDAVTIEFFSRHLVNVLASALDNIDAPLCELQMTDAEEHRRVVVEWNDTASEYPTELCIHELFEQQAERSPENVAVASRHGEMSYGELNRRANQLARHLIDQGVGPEVKVGICMERSVEMVVAVLGVLKAGGAYVPLDSDYPLDRLAFMLNEIESPVLISQDSLADRLPSDRSQVICMDTDWETIAKESDENLINNVSPENLAYVMYTSGSTGKPKGASIPHRAVNRLIFNTNYVDLKPHDKVAQVSSFSFDAATFEIWGALMTGAQLVIIEKDELLSSQEFSAQIRELGITTLFLTTALFNQLVSEAPSIFESVRYLLFGGQAVDPRRVRDVIENGPPAHLLHVYGPTESTTFATSYLIESVADDASTVPIGSPIANTNTYILDAHMQPVGAAVPGELYIGGDGLARNYFNRPDLTAEKFVPNPLGTQPGARLYRTGDLTRYLPDGSIEFLGRIDDQVKIRGFRVEPGEIEAVLLQHPSIKEGIVVTQDDPSGNLSLVAYLTPDEERIPTLSELRAFLKEKLPDYMVPADFVILNKLPLTPNGKIDRRALASLEGARPDLEEGYKAPRTPVEQILADIWTDVLRVERVGLNDNFFDLGGHSLLATQVVSQVQDILQVAIPLRVLFEDATVEALAVNVEKALSSGERPSVPPIIRVPRDQELPLSFAQQRLWFLYQLEPDGYFYNSPVATRLIGPLNVRALEQAISEIIRRHEILRTSFPIKNERPVQRIEPAKAIRLPIVDLSEIPTLQREQQIRRLATEEAQRPFDLGNGPVVRITLLRSGADEHIILLTMHHIVSDGWSRGIFVRELTALYEAFSKQMPSPLADLEIQYADYAHWQRGWLQGETLEGELGYWKKQLAGAPALKLPTDRLRPAAQSYRGESRSFLLSADLSDSLKSLSRREGVTLFMTLLAAFQALLGRLCGQDDIMVGSAMAGRNRSETEGLIGFFINTLVLRGDLSGGISFRQLLRRVKDTTLGAYTHQDLPFEKIVEHVQPDRDLSRMPLVQVAFGFQNAPMHPLKLSGIQLGAVGFDYEAVRFDLTLWISETPSGLQAHYTYSADLFEASTIARMHNQYDAMLEAIVAQPDAQLDSYKIIPDGERQERNENEQAFEQSNYNRFKAIKPKAVRITKS
jgi:amino acid adenylation domain-containing protein